MTTRQCSDTIIIAAVVPVFNSKQRTLDYLRRFSTVKTDNFVCDLVIVDDGSTDGTAPAIRMRFPDVTVLQGDGNLWWTGAVNMGIRYAVARGYTHILLMNNDVTFRNDFLEKLVDSERKYPCSIVGSITLRENSVRPFILKAGMKKSASVFERVKSNLAGQKLMSTMPEMLRVDAVSGRSVIIPVEIIKKIGILDEKKFRHGGADIEYGFRASKAGYKVFVNTRSIIYTTLGEDKNLYSVLKEKGRVDFLKTLGSLKYSWHIGTMFHMCTLDRNQLWGFFAFTISFANILKWLLFKIVFPPQFFASFVTWRGRKKATL